MPKNRLIVSQPISKYNALPKWMIEQGNDTNDLVKKLPVEYNNLSKAVSINFETVNLQNDDETETTLTKQVWFIEMPCYTVKDGVRDTGRERGRVWEPVNERRVCPVIYYPDAFLDILWEYAQSECDAAEKDVLAYATWYSSKKEYKSEVVISVPPSVTYADNTPPPSSTISAEKAGEFKSRLLTTLTGNKEEKILKKYVNYIINTTRVGSRKVGRAKAKTNPLVEEVMKKVDIDEKVPN